MNEVIIRDVVLNNAELDCRTLASLSATCTSLKEPCRQRVSHVLSKLCKDVKDLLQVACDAETMLQLVVCEQACLRDWIDHPSHDTARAFFDFYYLLSIQEEVWQSVTTHDIVFLAVLYYWFQKEPVGRCSWNQEYGKLYDIDPPDLFPLDADWQVVEFIYTKREDPDWQPRLNRIVACFQHVSDKLDIHYKAMEMYHAKRLEILDEIKHHLGTYVEDSIKRKM